jgi:hypothetical protein
MIPSNSPGKSLKRFVRAYQLPLFLVLVAAGIGSIYAYQDISQTAPTSPAIRSQTALTSSACLTGGTDLTWGNTTASSSTFLPTSSPAVLYCSGSFAFDVTRAGTDLPTINPSPLLYGNGTASSLLTLSIDRTSSCSSTGDSSYQPLTSGLGVSLLGGGYYYCVNYPVQSTTVATIGTFTVSWAS